MIRICLWDTHILYIYGNVLRPNTSLESCILFLFYLLCLCFVLVLAGFTHIVQDYFITTYCTRKLRSGVSAIWVGNLSLPWRHNERDGLSNHQRNDCLLKRISRRRSKKTWKLRVTGLCAGNSPETKGQYRGKCFHLMTSSSDNSVSHVFILQPSVCEIRRRACQRSFELFNDPTSATSPAGVLWSVFIWVWNRLNLNLSLRFWNNENCRHATAMQC